MIFFSADQISDKSDSFDGDQELYSFNDGVLSNSISNQALVNAILDTPLFNDSFDWNRISPDGDGVSCTVIHFLSP